MQTIMMRVTEGGEVRAWALMALESWRETITFNTRISVSDVLDASAGWSEYWAELVQRDPGVIPRPDFSFEYRLEEKRGEVKVFNCFVLDACPSNVPASCKTVKAWWDSLEYAFEWAEWSGAKWLM